MNVFGILTLALAASLSPVAITFLINIMGGKQGIQHGIGYTLGVLASFSIFGLLILLGVHGLDLAGLDSDLKSDYLVQLLAGIVLLWLGIRRLRRAEEPAAAQPAPATRSTWAFFALGMTTSFTNVTSLAPIAVAMAALKHSGGEALEVGALFLLFQVLVLWPLLLVIGLQLALGERVAPAYRAINRGIHRLTGPAMLLLTLGLGGYLIVHVLMEVL